MKKHKRSRHRIPSCALEPRSDPVDESYQAEIDASMMRLERRYQRAEKALASAEDRAERARQEIESAIATAAARRLQRRYDELLLIVEQRRVELREIERLMIPGDHNGRDSRRRRVRHETAAINIPLGATTGQRPKTPPVPRLPVMTSRRRDGDV